MTEEQEERPALLSAPSIEELANRFTGKDIVMVGNGPTGARDYSSLGLPLWVVNGGWRAHKGADLCWMMDDLEGPAWELSGRDPKPREYWEPITQKCPVPIMTSVAYPEKFPQTVAYPLQDVLDRFPAGQKEKGPRVYYAETICYATAWAIQIGVKSISFGGCDYGTIRPAERAGLEYWIGRAEEAGIPVHVYPGSQLLNPGRMDGKHRHVFGIYGYLDWPEGIRHSAPANWLRRMMRQVGSILSPGWHPSRSFSARGKGEDALPGWLDLPCYDDARLGHEALDALLAEDGIETVLDVGYGSGDHAREMAQARKRVLGLDPNGREGFNDQHHGGTVMFIQKDYMDPENALSEQFDAVWSCHMLEHVHDPQAVLRKMFHDLKDGGLLVLTVPPAQHTVTGGHFSLWNAGQLLYHLVLAGFDCREARIKEYGFNITVMVRKRDTDWNGGMRKLLQPETGSLDDMPPNFPLEKLKEFLPDGLEWRDGSFNGDIKELNW